MSYSNMGSGLLEAFTAEVGDLRKVISRVAARNVNSQALKNRTRLSIKRYFGEIRGTLEVAGIGSDQISTLDEVFQDLNRLASKDSRKTSYTPILNSLYKALGELDLEYQKIQGKSGHVIQSSSKIEKQILETVSKLVPSAGLSYQQALSDLGQKVSRSSYRGTANELRECLREVIDHMAPDKNITAEPGYKTEPNCVGPTQRQRIRFILNARGMSDTTMKSPMDASSTVDAMVSHLGRSIFQRTNLAAHVSSAKKEILRLKAYVDLILCELLEIEHMS